MVNTNALRGLIVSKGLTQEKVAANDRHTVFEE